MNKNPGAKQFWRVCGPILLYWLIEFVASTFAGFVVMIPHLGGFMKKLAEADVTTQEQATELMMQQYENMLNLIMKYQVEILAIAALCTIPLTAYLFHADRKRERTMSIPVNKKAEPWRYLEIIGLGAAVCIGLNCLAVMSNIAFASVEYEETSEVFYSASLPVQYLCLGIIIPLTEELMFRGVLFQRYRERSKFFSAALYSTILFSLTHGNMVQFLYTFVLGLLLAYVYEKFGSFKAPLLLHIVANMTSLILTNTGGFDWLLGKASRLGIMTVACAFIGSVMFVLIQRIDEKPELPDMPHENQNMMDLFR
ncbi:MAG: CPBP family intramembrane metalloprotease [Faecalicatena sp.]|uniref:CPBP family intramembrane glutamic endopeptidase n=1 Tax=Faecalicatena sp. TaxID=2005360 RepID=UPI00258AD52C|nr:CPBP family intramembrane glutamic endopeptidase [Faecalicatena sp.]MCI6465051.1 CPBP family intramembrane metalloprotease [Faecalicatena sp.]MDY5617118.1 CPBP family intramembrane glutamic endopeptidase [Lachnospiraceae bacterium]